MAENREARQEPVFTTSISTSHPTSFNRYRDRGKKKEMDEYVDGSILLKNFQKWSQRYEIHSSIYV